MTKDELILKWVNKKSEVTHEIYKMVKPNEIKTANLLVEHLNQIFDVFIEDLKNLPNELRAVNRNEAAKEFCECNLFEQMGELPVLKCCNCGKLSIEQND